MTGRAGAGIASGAGLPVARLPGHRWLRQAGQVIAGLLLTGLAAAVVWVLLAVVVALAGGVGPHFPGPPPHPVPMPNPAPATPGTGPPAPARAGPARGLLPSGEGNRPCVYPSRS
jgi:hypothetical protein